MEPTCDGSGVPAYYTFKGKRLLLCETLAPHTHCECGEPMLGGIKGDRCRDCNKRLGGLSIHHRKPYRENREHVSGVSTRLKENLQRRSAD